MAETTTTMSPEARAAKNRYRRKWAKDNPDKIKAQQARYWEKQARKDDTDHENSDISATDEG